MSTQPELDLTLPLARRSDPESSHEAADAIEPDLPRQRALVLEAIRAHPGRDTKTLAEVAGLDRYMVARRVPELERAGLIHRTKPAKGGPLRCWDGPANEPRLG